MRVKKSLRHSISLVLATVAATWTTPLVYDLADTMLRLEPDHVLVETSYYWDAFWRITLAIFLCDCARQIALRKVLFVRLVIEGILLVVASLNRLYWFYPPFEILVVALGVVAAYGLAIVSDLRAISRLSSGESQTPGEPGTASPQNDLR